MIECRGGHDDWADYRTSSVLKNDKEVSVSLYSRKPGVKPLICVMGPGDEMVALFEDLLKRIKGVA